MLLEPGRVCIKKFGRDAGSRAVILKVVNDNTVQVSTGTRPKPRNCNVRHLEFLNEKVDPSNRAQVDKVIGVKEQKPRQQPSQKGK